MYLDLFIKIKLNSINLTNISFDAELQEQLRYCIFDRVEVNLNQMNLFKH